MLGETKKLLRTELKKIQMKGTYKNSTPQDGDTYPYRHKCTNIRQHVTTQVQQIDWGGNNKRNYEENAEKLKCDAIKTGAVKSDLMRMHVRQKIGKINSNGENTVQCARGVPKLRKVQ